jgi:hypothetical protein
LSGLFGRPAHHSHLLLKMAELKEKAFVVSVVDARGTHVDGAQVQIFIDGIPKVQRHMRKGKPFTVQFSEGVQSVEVRVSLGPFRSRETVSTSIGTYTMTIPDEYLPQPEKPALHDGSAPSDDGTPTWVKVLGIAIPALVALIGGYWQFVYKPSHQQAKVVQLGIFVTDGGTGKAVGNAHVTLVRAARKEDRLADSLGTARFQVSAEEGKSLRVEVEAAGYDPGSREIDAPASDASYYVILTSETSPARKGDKGASVEPVVTAAVLAGTWEVAVSGDITNARLAKGTFDLMPQHDGSILCTANFEADGMTVTATGKASMQRSQIFLDFSATTSAGGSWNGKAEFTLSADHRHLTGRIQSKRGDDIPVTLNRV